MPEAKPGAFRAFVLIPAFKTDYWTDPTKHKFLTLVSHPHNSDNRYLPPVLPDVQHERLGGYSSSGSNPTGVVLPFIDDMPEGPPDAIPKKPAW